MTKAMQVILAVKALVAAALPDADVKGFDKDSTKPNRVGAGGCVIGHPGEPGEPEIDLSPLTYNYAHRLWLEVIGPNGIGGADLDAMLVALGTAIAADPTLGGQCYFFSADAPDFNDRSTEAVASTNWATVPLLAEYSTQNPLGN
jgi:hypothetical protein